MPMRASFILSTFLIASPALAQTFTDVSTRLDAQNDEAATSWGAAMVDIDGNGLLDIYEPARMYLQQADGFFESSIRLMIGSDYATTNGEFGSVFGDLDDDGFNDMFVMDIAQDRAELYMSRGGVRLVKSGDDLGIDPHGLVQGSIYGDFNGDGFLDLFVGEDTGNNQIFLADGSGGFVDATAGAGMESIVKTYGAAAADYDRDGDLDIFIAGCAQSEPEKSINLLLRNRGDGSFEEVGADAGINDDLAAWGVVWLDYDRDGWMDVFVANMAATDGRSGENKLYRNQGDGTFEDVTFGAGVAGQPSDLNFGVSAADFDNDGWVDLYLGEFIGAPYLFRNAGDGTFNEISADAGGLQTTSVASKSVAAADLNADGWVDLFTARDQGTGQNPMPNRLYYNDGGSNTWLKVDLIQSAPNRRAIGAQLALWNDNVVQLRDITAGDGFTSQNHGLGAHFGTGEAASLDSLVITWPDGSIDHFFDVQTDQHLWVEKGGTINRPPEAFEVIPFAILTKRSGLPFQWEESSDPEGNPLTYVVSAHSQDSDIFLESEPVTDASEVELDLSSIPTDETINWAVTVTDGVHIRRSTNLSTFYLGSSVEGGETPAFFALQSVYPNPATEVLNARVSARPGTSLDVRLTDTLGRVVQKQESRGAADRTIALDTSSLAAGVYLLRIEGGNTSVSRTVVILD